MRDEDIAIGGYFSLELLLRDTASHYAVKPQNLRV